MENLAIIGAGGHGQEVAFLVEQINRLSPTWNLLGFVDDQPPSTLTSLAGVPFLGAVQDLGQLGPKTCIAIAIGSPGTRRDIVFRLNLPADRFPNLIHPGVSIHETVQLGFGNLIFAGCQMTVGIQLGNHVHLNQGCTLSHGATLEDFVTLSPGCHVAGDCTLHRSAFLGTGVNTVQGISIGKECVVGAGATVVRDLPNNVVAVGVPAKPIQTS